MDGKVSTLLHTAFSPGQRSARRDEKEELRSLAFTQDQHGLAMQAIFQRRSRHGGAFW